MRIGIDFGGTKIEAAAVDEGGACPVRLRAPTPTSYSSALQTVADLVTQVERETQPVERIGIGIPGSVSPRSGLVRNANTRYLNGRRFGHDLSATLRKRVRLSNDANCLAVSEAVDGAGAGAEVLFAVILGTGCGGGVALNGEVIAGPNGLTGEWGHNPLPWPSQAEVEGPTCWCGRQGCLETWISGTGFRRDYQAHGGGNLSGPDIIAAMRAGNVEASAAFTRYLDRLARALATVVNILDPDVFVFGGGMANVTELYDALPDLIRKYTFSADWDAPLRLARWGDSSGVRGAARLWPN